MNLNSQPSPSMNRKDYKGLSLLGLAAHIASSILLWNKGLGHGTINDCKHAIAHNVRAFQRRLIKEQNFCEVWITPKAIESEKKQIELEHAIPVGCLMNVLFHKVQGPDLSEAVKQVNALLRENTVLVWVTKDEHAELNKQYQCKMPDGYDTYPWTCKLARYEKTLGASILKKWTGSGDNNRPAENDLDAEIEDDFGDNVDPLLSPL